MTEVDPVFVKRFNRAAALGRAGDHDAAERTYAALVEGASAKGARATTKFVATARMRRAFCLMDLKRYEDARGELEVARALEHDLDDEGRYELLFALGNVLGSLGRLDEAFLIMVEAISVAEDMDDYAGRPGHCWASLLRHGAEAKAWSFVTAKAPIALNTARLRGMDTLERLAAAMQEMAKDAIHRC